MLIFVAIVIKIGIMIKISFKDNISKVLQMNLLIGLIR